MAFKWMIKKMQSYYILISLYIDMYTIKNIYSISMLMNVLLCKSWNMFLPVL